MASKVRLTIKSDIFKDNLLVTVKETDNIRHVKQLLEKKTGIPCTDFRLTYHSTEMSNDETLGHQCPRSRASMHMIVCKPWIYVIVQVQTIKNHRMEVKAQKTDTVRELTDKLQLKVGMELDAYEPLLNDKHVSPESTLEDLKALSGDHLQLRAPKKPRSGSYVAFQKKSCTTSCITSSTHEYVAITDKHPSQSECPPQSECPAQSEYPPQAEFLSQPKLPPELPPRNSQSVYRKTTNQSTLNHQCSSKVEPSPTYAAVGPSLDNHCKHQQKDAKATASVNKNTLVYTRICGQVLENIGQQLQREVTDAERKQQPTASFH